MGRITGRIERRGPLIDAVVMATPDRVAALKGAGRPYPSPVTVRTLIDTGASGSLLDRHVIASLGLVPTGATLVHTPTTGSNYESRNIYDVFVNLGGGATGHAEFTVGVIDSELASEGFLALLGWDVLRACVLVCDGPQGVFTLEF